MIRGTTAQFKFKTPYNFADISILQITFWQENYNGPDETRPLPIVKTRDQCGQCASTKEFTVILNKEETLRFTDTRKAYVQMLGETIDGLAFGSDAALIKVYPVHDDSILDGDIVPTPTPGDVIILDGSTIA